MNNVSVVTRSGVHSASASANLLGNVVTSIDSSGVVMGMSRSGTSSSLSSYELHKLRVADEVSSDEQLKFIQKETKRLEKLMNIAIGFCERMKVRGLVSDENEFVYINYLYNQLFEGNEINDEMNVPNTDSMMTAMRLHQRGKIVNCLLDTESDVELIDKTASSTREFYCVDDTMLEKNANGEDFVQRKIRCAHDVKTGKNELFEVGYDDDVLLQDIKSPEDKGDVDLAKVKFITA